MLTDDQRHPVDILADDFASRLRAGEIVSMEDYVSGHPDFAELIRAVFPSVEIIERARLQQDSRHSGRSSENLSRPQAIPPRLGDFHLIREIGRGGMGVVYEAEQQSLRRRVALKVMSGLSSEQGNRRERFRREAEAAAGLHHTNIVGVFGIGEENGFLYYAMQLIRGVPLNVIIQRLRQSPNLGDQLAVSITEQLPGFIRQIAFTGIDSTGELEPVANTGAEKADSAKSASTKSGTAGFELEATSLLSNDQDPAAVNQIATTGNVAIQLGGKYFRFVAQVMASAASGLQYAHHAGIHHRDIKPSNLMLDHEGTLWITDFGVAKQASLDDMTQTGEIVGTLRYMAPEQLKGASDHQSDIYSLGLTLVELLTLQPAISSTTGNWFEAAARGCPRNLRVVRKEIPRDLEVIALKATAVDPSARYRSAAELENDLRRFLEDRPILARRESTITRLRRTVRRNPTVSFLTFASLLLLAVIAVMFAIGNHQKQVALQEIEQAYERAENSLQEKTVALGTADRERRRAETNLMMAIEAFETVIDNIGSRGGVTALLDDLGDDGSVVSFADAGLSDADIILLESLLSFFDRFAVENETDLGQEAAVANRRLGDIYQRLGRLEQADAAYRKSLDFYQSLRASDSGSSELLNQEIELIHELMSVAAERGRAGEVVTLFTSAQKKIEGDQQFAKSAEGRYALAKLSSSVASLGATFSRETRPRPDQPWNRNGGAAGRLVDSFVGQMSKVKLDREQQANTVALQLLHDLVTESPDNVAYRISLARAEREEIRLAQAAGEQERATAAYKRSERLFHKLSEQYPDSVAFKYELAQTLRAGMQVGGLEFRQYQRVVKLCDELVRQDSESADYRALRSSTYTRAAAIAHATGRKAESIDLLKVAIEDQRYLIGQYPTTPVYRLFATQSMSKLADTLVDEGRVDDAKRVMDEAIELVRDVRGRNRTTPMVQRLEARRKSLDDAN